MSSSKDQLHPTQGAFRCRTAGCVRVFESWIKRNAHEGRCNYLCAICNEHFQYAWGLESHLHGHKTGLSWRCQLGCTEKDRLQELPGRRPRLTSELPANVDKKLLLFSKEHEMRAHHRIDHGCTPAQTRRDQGVPASYNGPVLVPLVQGRTATDALEAVREQRRTMHQRTTANRGAAGKARDSPPPPSN